MRYIYKKDDQLPIELIEGKTHEDMIADGYEPLDVSINPFPYIYVNHESKWQEGTAQGVLM